MVAGAEVEGDGDDGAEDDLIAGELGDDEEEDSVAFESVALLNSSDADEDEDDKEEDEDEEEEDGLTAARLEAKSNSGDAASPTQAHG